MGQKVSNIECTWVFIKITLLQVTQYEKSRTFASAISGEILFQKLSA